MWRVEYHNGSWWAWPDGVDPLSAARRGALWWFDGAAWREYAMERSSSGLPPLPTPPGGAVEISSSHVVQRDTPIGDIWYAWSPAERYGPHFGDRNPAPDALDATVRPCSARREGYAWVSAAADWFGATESARQAILSLVENESGGVFARPANAFANPRRRSWGIFQPLTSSWQGLSDDHSYWEPSSPGAAAPDRVEHTRPWHGTPWEEVAYYTDRYTRSARYVRARVGAGDAWAARAIRVYHGGSAKLRALLDLLRQTRDPSIAQAAAWLEARHPRDADEDTWVEKLEGIDRDLRRWGAI